MASSPVAAAPGVTATSVTVNGSAGTNTTSPAGTWVPISSSASCSSTAAVQQLDLRRRRTLPAPRRCRPARSPRAAGGRPARTRRAPRRSRRRRQRRSGPRRAPAASTAVPAATSADSAAWSWSRNVVTDAGRVGLPGLRIDRSGRSPRGRTPGRRRHGRREPRRARPGERRCRPAHRRRCARPGSAAAGTASRAARGGLLQLQQLRARRALTGRGQRLPRLARRPIGGRARGRGGPAGARVSAGEAPALGAPFAA